MFKKTIFFFLITMSFIHIGCETEEIAQSSITDENNEINATLETASFSQTPIIEQALVESIGKSAKKQLLSKTSESQYWLDTGKVMKSIDSIGNISYALNIQSQDENDNEFLNLIVTERMDGEEVAPFVIRYKFRTGNISSFALDDQKKFDGTVDIYSLTEFASVIGHISGKSNDPVPCHPEVGENNYNTVTGTQGPGGSSSGTSGGSSTTGSTSGTRTSFSVTRTHISVSGYRGGSSGTVYGGVGVFEADLTCSKCQTQKSATIIAKTDNCPKTNVIVPVNENSYVVYTPDKPITNMTTFLKCFSSSKGAKVTVYANEPSPGSGRTHVRSSVGHTFVSITQGTSTATFGFYPKTDDIYPMLNPSDPSSMGEDGGEKYSASISTTVTGAQLGKILSFSIGYNKTYHLDKYNCTDFAIEVGNIAGMKLPDSYGSWPGGGGSNPGTLGKHIRSRTSNSTQTIKKSAGKAPATKKGC